jgi:ADP-ribose pyrophosphatase
MAEWLEKNTVYEGAILNVASARVRVGEQVVHFDVIEHNGGVAVVPLLGEEVLLVRQPRIVVGENLLEIPAGKLERGDDVEARARAELEEETGYRAGRLEKAVEFYVSPGYTTERIVIYLAFDLEPVGARPEDTEEIELVRLTIAEARRLLDEGQFRDGKTIIGLRHLLATLERSRHVA